MSEYIIFMFGIFYIPLLYDTLYAFPNLPLLFLRANNSRILFFLRGHRNFGINAAYSLELTMSLFSEFRPDNTIFN
jgi:hypothetical protein